jgi:peroxiredoxin Q/BCP
MAKITGKNVEVVGVSGDSPKSHEMFKKHNMLNFTLLADEKGEVAKKFGVPLRAGGEVAVKEFNTTIKRGVTAARWTFVIGKDGKIAYKNTMVNAAEDSKNILKTVEALK